jgi:hypothetical protein
MSEARDLYVLDTSAWLTLIEDEAGADRIEALLEQARAGEIVVLVSKKRGQTGIFMEFFVHRKGGFDHGIGHPLLLVCDTKAPNC